MTDDDKMDIQAMRLALLHLLAQLLTEDQVIAVSAGMRDFVAEQWTPDKVVPLRSTHPAIVEVTARAVAIFDDAIALRNGGRRHDQG